MCAAGEANAGEQAAPCRRRSAVTGKGGGSEDSQGGREEGEGGRESIGHDYVRDNHDASGPVNLS